MAVLFSSDQCGHEEWREADQEPWLCAVCGWMRWSVVATAEPEAVSDSELDAGAADDPIDETTG